MNVGRGAMWKVIALRQLYPRLFSVEFIYLPPLIEPIALIYIGDIPNKG